MGEPASLVEGLIHHRSPVKNDQKCVPAPVMELRKRGHRVEQQKEFPVYYDDQHIGSLIPDLIVAQIWAIKGSADHRWSAFRR
jgi:hypothetical protein